MRMSHSEAAGRGADLIDLITATDRALRDRPLDSACAGHSTRQLLEQCAALDTLRRRSDNLYERVRALLFLYAIHRFHLPARFLDGSGSTPPLSSVAALRRMDGSRGHIPFKGYEQLLQRRFEEAIDQFLAAQRDQG